MKNLSFSLLIIALIAMVGCGTPQKTAYTTLGAIGISVDKAMHGAAEMKVAKKIDDHQWSDIVLAHRRWQAAYNLAVDLAAQDYTKFAPSDVIALQTDLLELINKFTIK